MKEQNEIDFESLGPETAKLLRNLLINVNLQYILSCGYTITKHDDDIASVSFTFKGNPLSMETTEKIFEDAIKKS